MPSRNTIEVIVNARDNTGGVLQNVAGNLQTIGGVALGAVTAGLAAATAAVGAFSAQSLSAFTSFEQGVSEVFTLLPGITETAMASMEADIQSFMEVAGRTSEETLPALYQALSAGVPQDNVFEFLELANQAAIGGVTDLETAVDGISSVINAYGSDVIGATEASDLMFTSVRLGKTTMDELSQSLFNVVPTAAALGVSFGDITAAMATITSQGVPTSVATTQLRQMFVELGDAGTDVGQIFQDVAGTSFTEFIAQGNSTADAMQLMMEAAESTGIPLQQMFGSVEAANAALALTGTSMETFVSNTNEMVNSAGATEAAFDQMNDTLQYSLNLLAGRFQSALISVGRLLEPFAKPLIDTFSLFFAIFSEAIQTGDRFTDWVTELPGFFQPFGQAIANIGAGISEFFSRITNLMTGVREGRSEFSQFFTTFADGSSHLSGILEAMGMTREEAFALGAAINSTVARIQSFSSSILGLFNAINNIFAPLMEWLSLWIRLEDVIVVLGIAIAAVVIPAIVGIATALAPILALFGAMVVGVALLRNAWESNFLGIRDIILNDFLPGLQSALATVQEFFGGLFEAFQEGGFEGAATFILDNLILPLVEQISSFIGSGALWDTLVILGGMLFNAIATGIVNVANWVNTNIIQPVWTNAVNLFNNIDWGAVGTAIINGIGAAISAYAAYRLWVINNIYLPIFNAAVNFLTTTDWGAVGTAIIDGIGAAISATVDFLAWINDNVLQPILDNAQAAIENIDWFSVGQGIVNAIGNAITATFDFIGWIVSSIFSPIDENASSAADNTGWAGVGEAIMGAIGDFFTGVFDFIFWFTINVLAPLIGGAVSAIGSYDWSGVGTGMMDSIGDSLPDMVTWATNNIIRPIRDTLVGFNPMADVNTDIGQGGRANAGNTGNFGNPLNPLQLGLRAGQAFGNFIFGRQFGGQTGTSPIVVGESGRELFVPDTPGTVIPNQQTEDLLNGSQSPPVTINMYISGGVSDEVASDAAYKLKRELTAQGFQI